MVVQHTHDSRNRWIRKTFDPAGPMKEDRFSCMMGIRPSYSSRRQERAQWFPPTSAAAASGACPSTKSTASSTPPAT